jgi:hypothetical protein
MLNTQKKKGRTISGPAVIVSSQDAVIPFGAIQFIFSTPEEKMHAHARSTFESCLILLVTEYESIHVEARQHLRTSYCNKMRARHCGTQRKKAENFFWV